MRASYWRVFVLSLCAVFLLLLSAATPVSAQTAGGILRGQVTDPSGASVSGATILLTTPSGASMDTITNKDGFYEFKDLAPGKYQIKAVAQGFALFTKDGVVIAAGQINRTNISLELAEQQEKVEVQSTTTQVDVNPANNANSITLTGKDLDALSDDPDEMQSELQALAGPSAGPNGGQIYIDGFTAGQLPPKASIREIRINQNPFSTEYDKLGYGRIEIFTKPGTDKFHGQILIDGNTAAFNARNPFEILPAGVSPPGYNSEQYSGNIGGPLSKKASFFFNIDHREIGALSIVSATVVCGDSFLLIPCAPSQSKFSIIPFSDAVADPQKRTNLSPRLDYQLTPSNTLTARYQYFRDTETNQNSSVGQFNLAANATNLLETEHTIQLTDTQTVNPTVINEIRFQYLHDDTLTTAVNPGTNVDVGGAFSGVGSGGGSVSDIEEHYEFQDIVYKTFAKHSLKLGGRLRSIVDNNSSAASFNGSFIFGSQTPFGCTVSPTCPEETPIQVYQTTVSGLAAGLTIPEIRATYGIGGAQYYSQTSGVPFTSVTLTDLGLFAQDDWKVLPNLTVSYGLRFETQNHLANTVDLAPRIGLAWGIGGNAKNPPKTVLRAGYGIFYDRFTYALLLTQQRFLEGAPAQQQFLIQNPNFFLTGNPLCVPPLPTPVPPGCAGSTTGNQTIDYRYNSNLHAPYVMQTGVTLERQLSKIANIAFTYLTSRGVHQFYTDNVNPIDPAVPTVTPPTPVFQYESEGIFKQNQLIVNGSIRMGARLSLFGYYTLNYANSDTAGPTSMISIPGEPWKDYGRSSYDVRNRIFLGGTMSMKYAFRLSPFLIYSSGIPFNITAPSDYFGDSAYNVRPEFAPCATASYQTKFGCFATPTASEVGSYTPIPSYYGTGPGRFALMLRLSKTIGFGPTVESGGGSGGPGGGGGTFGGGGVRVGGGGRGPGGGGPGGGGGRGMDAGATNHRYALTFAVAARNVFNNVNVLAPIGNLGSPLFGESNGLVGRPFSDPTSNRRLDLQVTFSF
jgi:carboxypeptidase family protein